MTAHQEAPLSVAGVLGGQDIASEQQGLLDLIDKIQHAQIEGISLPRIVVVGDQSAGKSSVLEAVTGIPFPRASGACTRFATEIRLRRSRDVKFSVQILPDTSRQQADKERLQRFAASVAESTQFEAVMRRAVNEIAPQNIPGRFATKDVLVVEKWGPDLPLLTVVDLPGLVNNVNTDQSEEDVQAIDDLTNKYMKNSRTIILTIIGGNTDYVQQKILTKAKYFDPRGMRTIGVLTKPDVTREIGLEDKFVALVNNQDEHNQFRLGWYVLRNPGPHELGRQWTPEERQAQEDDFFSRGKWSVLPTTMRGATALKHKLSQQLMRHIARYVPKLRKEIQEKLTQTESELKALGTGKDTPAEMREDLVLLSSASKQLVTLAVDGTYKNPAGKRFFSTIARKSEPNVPTPAQNLRARVVRENGRFATNVREQGHHLKLIAHSSGGPSAPELSKAQYAREFVQPSIQDNLGTEFFGDHNPRLVYGLFQDFARNWSHLAQEHKSNIGIICNEFLAEVIDDTWPHHMREKLRAHFLDPQMNKLLEKAKLEVENLVADQHYEVQSYDPEYVERLNEWRQSTSADGPQYTTAEELLEKALIHYDLSAKTFISNVITQVVERHLLQGLDDIFSPVKVTKMTEQEVEDIALESLEIRERRLGLKATKKAIEESLEACANVAMRKELRAFAGEGFHDLENDSEDEDSYAAGPQRQKTPRKPVAEPAASTPTKQPQQQRRVSSQQTPLRSEPPVVSATSRYQEVPPDSPAPNYSRRSDERSNRMPGNWEEAGVAEQFRSSLKPNQYTSPAASEYTAPPGPPPPPPRPAKVPAPGGSYDGPPSPVESMNSPPNTRYAFSAHDLNSGRANFDEGTSRRGPKKITNFLRGQA